MLPMTRHRCNLKVWALAQSIRDGHCSLVTLERALSKYNEHSIFFISSSTASILFKLFLTYMSLVLRLQVHTVLSKSTN